MTRGRFAALALVISACGTKDYRVAATIDQSGFGQGKLTVQLRERGGAGVKFPGSVTVEGLGAKGSIKLDAFGKGAAEWPADFSGVDRNLRVCAMVGKKGHQTEDCTPLEVKVPAITFGVESEAKFDDLRVFKISGIRQNTRTEVWGESDQKKWKRASGPFVGTVSFDFGPGSTAQAQVSDGYAAHSPSPSELIALTQSDRLLVKFNSSQGWSTEEQSSDFTWLQVGPAPSLVDYDVGLTSTSYTLRNLGTEQARVRVVSGYRDGGSWMFGAIMGTRYFGEENVTIEPGATVYGTVSYPEPAFGGSRTAAPEVVPQ